MSTPPPCDPKIFMEGAPICTFSASPRDIEDWIEKVRRESGQQVDWHFSGGYAQVLFIGKYRKVKAAIEKLRPELKDAEQFVLLPKDARGRYRRGVMAPPPDDIRAIDS